VAEAAAVVVVVTVVVVNDMDDSKRITNNNGLPTTYTDSICQNMSCHYNSTNHSSGYDLSTSRPQ
jgi:hypothetical protein